MHPGRRGGELTRGCRSVVVKPRRRSARVAGDRQQVGLVVAEHGGQDVDAASDEEDQCGAVALALGLLLGRADLADVAVTEGADAGSGISDRGSRC